MLQDHGFPQWAGNQRGRGEAVAPRGPGSGSRAASEFVSCAPALAEGGPQDVLGGVGGRARGDRVSVGAVEFAEVDAVEGDPGVVGGELQLPGGLVDVDPGGASLRNAHHSRRPHLVR